MSDAGRQTKSLFQEHDFCDERGAPMGYDESSNIVLPTGMSNNLNLKHINGENLLTDKQEARRSRVSRVSKKWRNGEEDSFDSIDLDQEEEVRQQNRQVNLEDLLEDSQRKLIMQDETQDLDVGNSLNPHKRQSMVRGPMSQLHSAIQVQFGNPNPDGDEDEMEQEFQQLIIRFGSHSISLKSFELKSLNYFSITNPIRLWCIVITRQKYYEYAMLAVIFLNCITLALYNYEGKLDPNSSHDGHSGSSLEDIRRKQEIINQTNIAFTILYIIEAFVKVIADGLILHQASYMRSGWNVIDELVIITGVLEFFINPIHSITLRILRGLFRPLKSVNATPNMKALIKSLLRSLPEFANVGIFLVFIFVLFATIGLQQYNGFQYNKCRYTQFPPENATEWEADFSLGRACSTNGQGYYTCPSGLYCENIELYQQLSTGSEHSERLSYLNFGVTNFDNLGNSLLTVFQMITSETWTQSLINMMDVDVPIIGAMYTFLVIIVGQFFMLNLILAVIIDAFMKKQEEVRVEGEHENSIIAITEGEEYSESEQISEEKSESNDPDIEREVEKDQEQHKEPYALHHGTDYEGDLKDESSDNLDDGLQSVSNSNSDEDQKQDIPVTQRKKDFTLGQDRRSQRSFRSEGAGIKSEHNSQDMYSSSSDGNQGAGDNSEITRSRQLHSRNMHHTYTDNQSQNPLGTFDAPNDKVINLGQSIEDRDGRKKKKSKMRRMITRTVDEQLFTKNPSGKSDIKAQSFKLGTDDKYEEADVLKGENKIGRGITKSRTLRSALNNESFHTNKDDGSVMLKKKKRKTSIKKIESGLKPISIMSITTIEKVKRVKDDPDGNLTRIQSQLQLVRGKPNPKLNPNKKKPGQINPFNDQVKEEERKYKNNEDFTAFLRPQAQKRKFANIFFKIKDNIDQEESIQPSMFSKPDETGSPKTFPVQQQDTFPMSDSNQKYASPMPGMESAFKMPQNLDTQEEFQDSQFDNQSQQDTQQKNLLQYDGKKNLAMSDQKNDSSYKPSLFKKKQQGSKLMGQQQQPNAPYTVQDGAINVGESSFMVDDDQSVRQSRSGFSNDQQKVGTNGTGSTPGGANALMLPGLTQNTNHSKRKAKTPGLTEDSNGGSGVNMKVSFLGFEVHLSQIHEDNGEHAQSGVKSNIRVAEAQKKNRSTFQMGDKFSQIVDEVLTNQGNSNIRASANFEKLFKVGLPSKDQLQRQRSNTDFVKGEKKSQGQVRASFNADKSQASHDFMINPSNSASRSNANGNQTSIIKQSQDEILAVSVPKGLSSSGYALKQFDSKSKYSASQDLVLQKSKISELQEPIQEVEEEQGHFEPLKDEPNPFAQFNNQLKSMNSKASSNQENSRFASNSNTGSRISKLIGKKLKIQTQEDLLKQLEEKLVSEFRQRMTQDRDIFEDHKEVLKERAQKSKVALYSQKLTASPTFQAFIFVLLIANIVLQLCDSFPLKNALVQTTEDLNIAYLVVMVFECVVKSTAFGIKLHWISSRENRYDIVIMGITCVDVAITQIYIRGNQWELSYGFLITVIKAFRIIRFFKLARFWTRFQILLDTLMLTAVKTISFGCLVVFVMLSYTLVGQELFQGVAKFDSDNSIDLHSGTAPLFNFDNFSNSFITVFLILLNESQSTIYFNYQRAVGHAKATSYWVPFVFLANKILLNVFLAILLENFNQGSAKYHTYTQEKKKRAGYIDKNISEILMEYINVVIEKQREKGIICKKKKPTTEDGSTTSRQDADGVSRGATFDNVASNILSISRRRKSRIIEQSPASGRPPIIIQNLDGFSSTGGLLNSINEQTSFGFKVDPKNNMEAFMRRKSITFKDIKAPRMYPEVQGKSLSIVPEDNIVRIFLYRLLINYKFQLFIVFCIVVSSIDLALSSPLLDPNSKLKQALYWIDLITIGIFTAECVAKVIVYGFIFNGPTSYLRGIWNILEFFILVFSYICLAPSVEKFKVVKTFRILRSLRLVSRNEGLKVAVRALFFAIPNIFFITIVMLIFNTMFAVVAISHFKGKMFHCSYSLSDMDPFTLPITTKWDCLDQGGSWIRKVYNFDNIINASVTLFVMSTPAGWGEMMYETIMSTDVDFVPDHHKRPTLWISFFTVFVIVGFLFFLNLFVGVVINTFRSEAEKADGSELLTDKQKEWIDLRLLVLRSQPIKQLRPPENKFKRIIYLIQANPNFERFIQICIITNTLVLMIKWYRQPEELDSAMEIINYIFTIIFTSEAAVRIIGIGHRNYFQDGWNVFDFFVAGGSLIGILLSSNSTLQIRGTSILRAFRILRLLRLLKRGGKSLYMIFNTFVITMQSLANIGGLLLLIMYIYSIIGMIYLGEIKRNGYMNAYLNFETFWNAFITLFTVATADTWNYTMAAFVHGKDAWNDCIDNPTYNDFVENGYKTIGCGTQGGAFAYFVSYMFVVSLVFLKLFIAIILEGYSKTQVQDTRLFNNDAKEHFRDVWAEFDPEATTFIKLADIRPFLFAVGGPLGFDESFKESRFLQDRFIASLELPTYHNFQSYQFLDLLDALSFRLMVLDHINKIQDEQYDKAVKEVEEDFNAQNLDERDMKIKLEKEVNKLIFQKQSENIVAFKELWDKEQRKQRNREKNKDQTGLTSSHHMALEAAIRRIKVILAQKRQARLSAQQEAERKRLWEEEQRVQEERRIAAEMSGKSVLFRRANFLRIFSRKLTN